ncbi:ATP-dependent RNA helicase HrpA [Algisphaera agarilytica]|uniref:RNA helicase n=1 Tax=Algisphaera agarilytica TaxID=1385975 RepID=A0A7X0LJ41_9BACT|nr:ATP-dependent RNA helicase HrpA [Algisphaera agarilytica]MBB6428399.1 ATP-dependent helicase HrpA [Algisphaera agarilytica]
MNRENDHQSADLPGRKRYAQAMVSDQAALKRLAKKIRDARKANKPHDRNLKRLHEQLDASVERRGQREAAKPTVSYPDELPISQKRDDIAELIRNHQVTVVCGETGSGKSTQLPKILLDLGHGVGGMIAHTQPRRIAARTLASRVAEELGVRLGDSVGYAVRFNDQSSPLTHIRYLTDGLLLAELGRDPDLLAYDAIIIDEAHERSLNIDFLLGYLKRLLPRRPDLKLVITSATIDPQRFADYFGQKVEGEFKPAPIIEVSGRTYPVEMRYHTIDAEDADAALDGPALDRALCESLDEVTSATDGDVLVFMPTERAISQAAKALRSHVQHSPHLSRGKPIEILPLYARLSNAEQQKVFNPKGNTRRVVIATNVAESSVTVPNITAVIDPGTARISRYSPRTRMQRLPIEAVSQASANQRAGRCGRVAPGVCIRLCSEEQFAERDAFTTPEILRTSLAAVILRMAALRLGDIETFPFLEPPKAAAIREGTQTLRELGAIHPDGRLTPIGKQLAKLPIDPRVGRMVLAAADEGSLAEVLIIASALEGQDPRLRPNEHAQAADQAHAAFIHPASDFLSLLKLWDFVHEEKARLSNNQFRKSCQKHFISYPRLREWFDLHRQLVDLSKQAGLKSSRRVTGEDGIDKMSDAVHRALLAGLLSNVALKTDVYEYTGAHNTKLKLWPGSALAKNKNKPRWIVCAEIVVTSQQFARTCAQINPDWVEPIAGSLVKLTHREPHWVRRGGFVAAFEKASLFGLVLVPKRRIRFAKVEPALARQMFIQEALVEQDADIRAPFFDHNRQLRERIEKMQAKQRRFDLIADAEARFEFYDKRLPADVFGVAELNRFRKQAERDDPQVLFMQESDLLAGDAPEDDGRPDHLAAAGMKLSLDYKYDSGAADDGVTLQVPLHALGRLQPTVVDWCVPGLLAERIAALIRSLPKQYRKPLVPAPTSAAEAVERIAFGEGEFLEAVAEALSDIAGERLDPALFDLSKIEAHHQMNIAVVDESGKVLEQGRDVGKLQDDLGAEAGQAAANLSDPAWQREGLREWPDIDELPVQVEINPAGYTLLAYPTLIDEGSTIGLSTVETPERAEAMHRAGVLRLATLVQEPILRDQIKYAPEADQLRLLYSPMGSYDDLSQQLAEHAVSEVYRQRIADYPPRSSAAFEALLAAGRDELDAALTRGVSLTLSVLQRAQQLKLELDKLAANCPPGWEPAIRQTQEQLHELLPPGFVKQTPAEWLAHLPRYLSAAQARLRKLDEGKVDRDQTLAAQLASRLDPYRRFAADAKPGNDELTTYRWMLEEWRVSLFAQELGTSIPVSDKRLDKQWKKAQRVR